MACRSFPLSLRQLHKTHIALDSCVKPVVFLSIQRLDDVCSEYGTYLTTARRIPNIRTAMLCSRAAPQQNTNLLAKATDKYMVKPDFRPAMQLRLAQQPTVLQPAGKGRTGAPELLGRWCSLSKGVNSNGMCVVFIPVRKHLE